VLSSLLIRNFVLIEDAVLDFGPGLTVLTGETGAGKTLLTRALGLLMGERAEEGLVGTAGDEALIQAVFTLEAEDLAELSPELREMAGLQQSGELIITRRLGPGGRNRCYVNETAVTLTTMAAVAGAFLSFAGQHEYRRLLDPRYQLTVLDHWAGPEVVVLARRFAEVWTRARAVIRSLEEQVASAEARRKEMDLLRFQVAELAAADLSVEEETALQAELRLLSRAEDIVQALNLAAELLRSEGEHPDATRLLAEAAGLLGELEEADPTLGEWAGSLRDLREQLVELGREFRHYAERVPVDPERLRFVEERLRLYSQLARKYGGTTAEAMAFLERAREELGRLESVEEDTGRLREERERLLEEAEDLATRLRAARREAIPSLEAAVNAQLADLGMESASLRVALEEREGWEGLRESGGESAEFLLAANPGQPYRSLAKTASGGELSRVLLAIKCALAGLGGRETLVFDEIDAGIGGRTAVSVAQKLRQLSRETQLLVVTHLAPVAAVADHHFLIEKATDGAGAVTRLSRLSGEAVVAELCRMMGGRPEDAEAMAHARQLRDRAASGLLD